MCGTDVAGALAVGTSQSWRLIRVDAAQQREIDAFRGSDELTLPSDIDFRAALPSVSIEEAEILTRTRPANLHAARRIAGGCAVVTQTVGRVALICCGVLWCTGIRPSTLVMLYQFAKRLAKLSAAS